MQGIITGQTEGFNPKAMNPNFLVSGTTSTTNVAVVSVSGMGYLTSLAQGKRNTDTQQGAWGRVTVVIDGTTILNDIPYSYSGEHGGFTSSANKTHVNSNIFWGLFKFTSSLVIYHRTEYAASPVYTYAGYLLN